jgi:hypothetical protein
VAGTGLRPRLRSSTAASSSNGDYDPPGVLRNGILPTHAWWGNAVLHLPGADPRSTGAWPSAERQGAGDGGPPPFQPKTARLATSMPAAGPAGPETFKGSPTPREDPRAGRRAPRRGTRGPSRPGSRRRAAGSASPPASSEGAPPGRSWPRSVTYSTRRRRDPAGSSPQPDRARWVPCARRPGYPSAPPARRSGAGGRRRTPIRSGPVWPSVRPG